MPYGARRDRSAERLRYSACDDLMAMVRSSESRSNPDHRVIMMADVPVERRVTDIVAGRDAVLERAQDLTSASRERRLRIFGLLANFAIGDILRRLS